MEKIILAQLIAHLVADLFAQPECVSRKKQERILRSWHLYVHVAIVFVTSVAMTFTCGFVLWAAAAALLHFGIDWGKCSVERAIRKRKNTPSGTYCCNRPLFFADRILHFAVIWATAMLYVRTGGAIPGYYDTSLFTADNLLLAVGLLLCLKPANVLIQICFQSLRTDEAIAGSLDKKGLQKAGHWIGSMERTMTFILFVLGHYTVIGFIIGAKSILRYSDKENLEYVLVGTLMSFSVALALGVGITSGLFENVINVICCNI
jgi:hypothetical protein